MTPGPGSPPSFPKGPRVPSGPAPRKPPPPDPWWARLFYIPEKVDSLDVLGRTLCWLLLLVWGASFLRFPFNSPKIGLSFLHHIHLVFHEAGHILFIPLGTFMRILGGSLLQCLWPLIMGAFAVMKYKNPFAAAVCLWWSGQSLIDVAPYIADARIMDMPLLGETSDEDADLRPERHDWHRLLESLGALNQDLHLARICYWTGVLVMATALTWGAWLILQQRRRITAAYFSERE